jgi:hypothetical protein
MSAKQFLHRAASMDITRNGFDVGSLADRNPPAKPPAPQRSASSHELPRSQSQQSQPSQQGPPAQASPQGHQRRESATSDRSDASAGIDLAASEAKLAQVRKEFLRYDRSPACPCSRPAVRAARRRRG